MINIDFDALNPLEQKIHETLSDRSKVVETIRITEAAELCDCSVSKISKFAKKLGLKNYKQYLDFLYGRDLPEANRSSELARLQEFIKNFDRQKVDELVELIKAHDKIVLFGYGPSFLCAQYFEYRLRTCTNKVTIAVPDVVSVASMVDERTLLLFFTVTGTFASFDSIYQDAKEKGGEVALIIEEYNTAVFDQADKIFCLTREVQSKDKRPFEKTRTLFFIFMEEVVGQLTAMQKAREGAVERVAGERG